MYVVQLDSLLVIEKIALNCSQHMIWLNLFATNWYSNKGLIYTQINVLVFVVTITTFQLFCRPAPLQLSANTRNLLGVLNWNFYSNYGNYNFLILLFICIRYLVLSNSSIISRPVSAESESLMPYPNVISWPSLHMNNIRESLIKKGHNLREITSHNIESW